MTTGETKLLFSWDDVDALPDLRRLSLVLDRLPDDPVIEALRAGRGRGRDDYPVEAMWRALIAGVVFQHPSIGLAGRHESSLEWPLGAQPHCAS